ncbi:hypothetical protein LWC34_04875 [Kibdelosporangium philippinense]|uniref:Glycosyl hydrolases family 43 n=2 Tax=Kibdelosporangium philippinense TaxID=211113 RepID=A0ABS8Z6G8_9PSEU|nr:hypothetical protein [Kibdelosporangium philippinense]MCE7002163.1 hypothetical protein [Kibdelosporangium philippinense]
MTLVVLCGISPPPAFGEPSPQEATYFPLGPPTTVLTQSGWETEAPHTLSVVEPGRGGFRYWGYYGLQECGGIGRAWSNDLVNWVKDPVPLFHEHGERWPSVLLIRDEFRMVHTVDYCRDSYIVTRTSRDGLNFTEPATLVPPEKGWRNQNPNLFKDPRSGRYYLYWYRGDDTNRWEIRVKSARSIRGLLNSPAEVLMSANSTLAAPNVLYYRGTYYLAVEVLRQGIWETNVLTSVFPDRSFREISHNPVLGAGSACLFQHIFQDKLHVYYCKLTGEVWTVEHRAANLTEFGRGRANGPLHFSGGRP